jgi:hypothetical protein
MSGLGNRKRALTDVVTVDAWHDIFNGKIKQAALHAHVHFGQARIGDEPNLKISFRLGIRQAEVILVVPETEGLMVDKSSVARRPTKAKFEAVISNRTTKSKAWISKVGGVLGLKPKASASAARTGTLKTESERRAKTTLSAPMLVSQSQTAEGHYRWQIVSAADDCLVGQPWDAEKEPRLTLVDQNAGKDRSIEPAVRIEVRCLREDLLISDIKVTDASFMDRIKGSYGHRNNEIAAECFIRDELIRNGLGVGDIHNRFASITIAAVIAESV